MAECFSRVESVRCRGLSETQYIIVYLPSGLSLLLVPVLLALAWKHPRATIILLAIELLLRGTVETWNLVTQLVPPLPDSFRSQDLALGAISALPLLFLLLFTTSFLISDLRVCLPHRLQSSQAALLFSSLILPLLPAAFVANLLGNVLFVGYFRVGTKIQLGFERTWFRDIHETLVVIGIATATGFLALILGLALATAGQATTRARWQLEYRSLSALWLLSCGLLLAGVDIALGLVRESFAVILTRRLLGSGSRVLLTVGLVGSYYPGSSTARQSIQLPMDPPKRSREQKRQPDRPIRPSISGPVSGSFHRMSRAATHSFHTSPRARENTDRVQPEKAGDGDRIRGRVVLRNDAKRGPKLSIAPSTFDQADLASLAGQVRDREESVQRAIAMNEELAGGADPFLSPEEQRERYLHIKQGLGSIYKPTLIPVNEVNTPIQEHQENPVTRSGWPIPPDFHPRTGMASWNALSGQDDQSTSQNHRVGQVAAHRTADHLHPTPARSNSGKRKPVPELDSVLDMSMAGHLSFISGPSTHEADIAASPSVSPPASLRDDERRDTDPAAAVIPRSPEGSSIYSQSTDHPDDRTLFFRPPIRSPSTASPTKSSAYSPHVSIVPPSRTSMADGWREDQPEMAMALSSLARVRRDTGVDLPNTLEPQSANTARLSGNSSGDDHNGRQDAIDRSSTTTWTSDDLTPRASERGWWGADK